jgi:hypothetical protein
MKENESIGSNIIAILSFTLIVIWILGTFLLIFDLAAGLACTSSNGKISFNNGIVVCDFENQIETTVTITQIKNCYMNGVQVNCSDEI